MTKAQLLRIARAKCLDCSGTALNVENCESKDTLPDPYGCPLWPVRFGKDPDPPSEAKRKAGLKAAARNLKSAKPDGSYRKKKT